MCIEFSGETVCARSLSYIKERNHVDTVLSTIGFVYCKKHFTHDDGVLETAPTNQHTQEDK